MVGGGELDRERFSSPTSSNGFLKLQYSRLYDLERSVLVSWYLRYDDYTVYRWVRNGK